MDRLQFIGMKWVHFIPNEMNLAFHSSLTDQFIPTAIKWIHSIPPKSVRQQRMARSINPLALETLTWLSMQQFTI